MSSPTTDSALLDEAPPFALEGERVCLVGRFVSAPRKRLATLVAELGGRVVPQRGDSTLLVIGDGGSADASPRMLEGAAITETQLLERLGVLESGAEVRRLYTPAMLAELTGAPLVAIRRWERRGYLEPTERLGRLTRYDFGEATVAQLMAALLVGGRTLAAIDRMVEVVERSHPDVERPLVELPLIAVEGALLLRDGDHLAEPDGQRRLEFADADGPSAVEERPMIAAVVAIADEELPPVASDTTAANRTVALELREAGDARAAIERYRVAMGCEQPTAEDHFTLAELLFEAGDTAAARERYYAALELDGDYLEARVNLGVLLGAEGETELAIAALEGALDGFEPYADAHYHLAALLDREGRTLAAQAHWRRFLEIAPESPWAEEARQRL